jgi:hypothetical protein
MNRSGKLVAAGALGAALALSACSSSPSSKAGGTGNSKTATEPPASAVTTAFSDLSSQSSVSLTFSLGITAAQAEVLNAQTSGSKMTQPQLHALTTGSIVFEVATGGGEELSSAKAKTDRNSSFDLGLNMDGNTPFELRVVDQNIYLKTDVGQLGSDVGQTPQKTTSFTTLLQRLNQYVPGIDSLAAGKWVEVSHQSLAQLAPELKRLGQGTASSPTTVNQAQARSAVLKLVDDLENALKANTTFTNLGTTGGRSEYGAVLNVSSLASAVIPVLQQDLQAIPSLGSTLGSRIGSLQSRVPPGKTASADVYVKDNKVSEVDLDLDQFMTKKPPFPVPLRMIFGQPGPVSAPSGATMLDLSKLPSLLSSLGG